MLEMSETATRSVGRPPKMEAPRERILAEATRLFSRAGYEATSLQEVAAAVGITKAAVYHYFPTKQVMYETIVVDLLNRLESHVVANLTAPASPRDRLKALMLAHADFFEANYEAFVTLLHGVSGLSRKITEHETQVRDRYEKMVRGILNDGARTGDLHVADVRATSIAILAMLNWMSRWYKPKGSRRARDFAEDFFVLIDQGLSPRN
jgi:AcrR family transcriptional regulator